jgi:hypothetical protein
MSKQPKFEGLTTAQKKWAHEKVRMFKLLKVAVPYGMIVSEAKKITNKNN